MGNKKDPRKVTITEEPTLITDLQTRKRILMRNDSGSDIGLHRRAADDAGDPVEFADCFPFNDGELFDDDKSSDQLWGILEAAGTVEIWVWETEF